MVMKMNKEKLIGELKKVTKLDDKECTVLNDILENNFIIGKNGKEKIIKEIKERLNMDDKKAEKLYESAMGIIAKAVKDKIKNPFKK